VRDRASLARQVDDGDVENVYRLQVMNATETVRRVEVAADGLPGLHLREPVSVELHPVEARWISLVLRVPADTAHNQAPGAHEIRFTVTSPAQPDRGSAYSLTERSTFVLPRP
jgi:polyferredoxin